jgi:hypothetical protein
VQIQRDGTSTQAERRPSVAECRRQKFGHDKISGVPYKDLLIAVRGELGEIGGRPHFHCLLGGVTTCNMMSLRSQMFRSWKIISGNADGDFRLYDRSLMGADYVCKCLGANSYEINKFSIAKETTLSDSVISLIRVLDAKSGRRCCEIERKDRQVAKAGGCGSHWR